MNSFIAIPSSNSASVFHPFSVPLKSSLSSSPTVKVDTPTVEHVPTDHKCLAVCISSESSQGKDDSLPNNQLASKWLAINHLSLPLAMAEKPKKLNRFESGSVELGVMSEEATSFVYYGNMPTECIQFLHNELPVFHKSTAQQINEEAAASLRGVEEETDLESSEDEYNNIYSKDGWCQYNSSDLLSHFLGMAICH